MFFGAPPRNAFPALRDLWLFAVILLLSLAGPGSATSHAQARPTASAGADTSGGPIRLLRQPLPGQQATAPEAAARRVSEPAPPYIPGEFEQFVQRLAGGAQVIRRFGADFLAARTDASALADYAGVVPADYQAAPGDEIHLTVWGSVEADLNLVVNKVGRIQVPRVGAVPVAGLKQADLADAITRKMGQTFRNFQLSVSMGQLRSIRVLVTGAVVAPGAYIVSSLSGLSAALIQAGGPSAAGSFRSIELKRRGQLVAALDLYDLLLRGDRAADPVLQNDDVVHVGPVGLQVGVIGSVNRAGVYEMKTGEAVADALRMAGGFSAVADIKRVSIERLRDRANVRIVELGLPAEERSPMSSGDVIRAYSAVSSALPSERQAKRVRVEGEVHRPGDYLLPAGSTIDTALQAAGGLTDFAHVYATAFYRESVRLSQGESYDRALRDLETDFARSSSSQRTITPEDAAAAAARSTASSRLVERLRALQPSGRIVLQTPPEARELPPLALEDGDRIQVPARSTTVGVFGSVFNGASYLYAPGRTMDDYLRLAGGPTKGADTGSVFVVRANGTVISRLQGKSGWFNQTDSLSNNQALPGDTIFVPEEMNKTTFVQDAKDWTQILYQFGIGLAGIKSAVK